MKTPGCQGHAWAPDGMSRYVLDERWRLLKTSVTLEPSLGLSASAEVADFAKLGIDKWEPIGGGRFLVNFTLEGFEDVRAFNVVLNRTEVLNGKVPAAKSPRASRARRTQRRLRAVPTRTRSARPNVQRIRTVGVRSP